MDNMLEILIVLELIALPFQIWIVFLLNKYHKEQDKKEDEFVETNEYFL